MSMAIAAGTIRKICRASTAARVSTGHGRLSSPAWREMPGAICSSTRATIPPRSNASDISAAPSSKQATSARRNSLTSIGFQSSTTVGARAPRCSPASTHPACRISTMRSHLPDAALTGPCTAGRSRHRLGIALRETNAHAGA